MLLASFFPLVVLILAVLGSIVFGLATPTEAAAIGAFGGYLLAAIYMVLNYPDEKRRRLLFVWIPLWIPFLVSVIWFRYRRRLGMVPTWFGVLAIAGVAIWAVLALRESKLLDTVRESSYLTAQDQRDGVLAVCRQFDLLGGVRPAGWPAARRELGPVDEPVEGASSCCCRR